MSNTCNVMHNSCIDYKSFMCFFVSAVACRVNVKLFQPKCERARVCVLFVCIALCQALFKQLLIMNGEFFCSSRSTEKLLPKHAIANYSSLFLLNFWGGRRKTFCIRYSVHSHSLSHFPLSYATFLMLNEN